MILMKDADGMDGKLWMIFMNDMNNIRGWCAWMIFMNDKDDIHERFVWY